MLASVHKLGVYQISVCNWFGAVAIVVGYCLSRRVGFIGTPERPLSDLGQARHSGERWSFNAYTEYSCRAAEKHCLLEVRKHNHSLHTGIYHPLMFTPPLPGFYVRKIGPQPAKLTPLAISRPIHPKLYVTMWIYVVFCSDSNRNTAGHYGPYHFSHKTSLAIGNIY